jgi:hypothetical protein
MLDGAVHGRRDAGLPPHYIPLVGHYLLLPLPLWITEGRSRVVRRYLPSPFPLSLCNDGCRFLVEDSVEMADG